MHNALIRSTAKQLDHIGLCLSRSIPNEIHRGSTPDEFSPFSPVQLKANYADDRQGANNLTERVERSLIFFKSDRRRTSGKQMNFRSFLLWEKNKRNIRTLLGYPTLTN